jgi:DNA-binding CsgD family transcriptional regulator
MLGIKTINNVLLSLHSGCRVQTVENFKAWALNEIQGLVDFDKANWGSGVFVDDTLVFFGGYQLRLDAEFTTRFNEMSHLDTRANELLANPRLTLNRDAYDPEDTNQTFRRYVLDPSGVRYGLYSGVLDQRTGVFDGLVLMRPTESPAFTEQERSTVESLAPHLAQACAANRLERAQDIIDSGRRAAYKNLVCSRAGLLIAAAPDATQMLLKAWPEWRGGRLPAPLAEAIKGITISGNVETQKVLRLQTFVAHIHIDGDQVLVRLREPNVIDSLGQRELSVAQRFAEGASYKEIAQALQISPSTVSNQLSVVYAKLAVSNKIALRQELERWR